MLTNGDSYGYYSFLPMTFIHHDADDLSLSTYYRTKNMKDHIDEDYTIKDMPDYWFTGVLVNGKRVIQYNCGVALLQLPFFFIGHVCAKVFGFSADGYSLPYRMCLLFGNLVYVMCGLLFIKKILRRYFDNITVNLTLFVIMFTTNLYYFTAFSGFMAHSYLFFMYAFFIYAMIRFYETFSHTFLYLMGFIAGFIMLIRPPDIVILVLPFLFKLHNLHDIKTRFTLIWHNRIAILGAVVCFFIPFLPQFYYWKQQTGHWIFYLYDKVSFNFQKPEIVEGLTSFANGWLIYTPVMFFALCGLFLNRRSANVFSQRLLKVNDFRWAAVVFTFIYVYIIFSWPIRPFYINGFGCRPMVETYALLAYPLSIFIDFVHKNRVIMFIFTSILIFFTWLNVFQTYQMSRDIIVSENMNKAFWLSSFGKTTLDARDLAAYDSNEWQPNKPLNFKKSLYENHFEDSINTHFTREIGVNGVFGYKIEPNSFFEGIHIKGADGVQKNEWIKVSLRAMSHNNNIYDVYQKTRIVVQFTRGETDLKWRATQIENKIANPKCNVYGGAWHVWDDVFFYVRVPSSFEATDALKVYLWSTNPKPLMIDDIKIELYK